MFSPINSFRPGYPTIVASNPLTLKLNLPLSFVPDFVLSCSCKLTFGVFKWLVLLWGVLKPLVAPWGGPGGLRLSIP